MGTLKHFTGAFVIGDDEGEAMQFQSHTEMQTALVMLARPNVVGLENQVPFGWTHRDGTRKTHFFDFRVSLSDGSRIALMVKQARKAAEAKFRAEMRWIAQQARPQVADRVSLITENDLDPIEVYNAELVHSVRIPDPEPDAAVRRVVAGLTGAARISDIVAACGCGGSGFRSVVRLIRTRELELATYERIDTASLVRRRLI
jgi:hypothetical protein